jgi:hypothetical protein
MIFFSFGMFAALILLCVNNYRQYDFNLFMINSSYIFINLFSKFQVYFFKINKELNKIIEQCPLLLNFKNIVLSNLKTIVNEIEFIKDGTPYKKIINDYDFVIYSNNEDGNSERINKIIFTNKSDISNKYELSNIKFMLLELKVGDKLSFIIDLKKTNYNFYIVGNIFNLKFFEYYVKSIMNENVVFNDEDKITLNILDQNVNNHDIELKPKNQSILLEKSDYKTIN